MNPTLPNLRKWNTCTYPCIHDGVGIYAGFYQFVDTIIEVKIAIKITRTSEYSRTSKTSSTDKTNSFRHKSSFGATMVAPAQTHR